MDKISAIYISNKERLTSGYICAFCNRIFDNINSVNQVVVAPSSEAVNSFKMRWMCEICIDQGRYITVDGLVLLTESTKVTVSQVHKEWGQRIYSRYRKEVLGKK